MLIKFIDYEGTFRVTSIKYPLTIKISLYTLYLHNLKLKYSAPPSMYPSIVLKSAKITHPFPQSIQADHVFLISSK